MGPSPPRMPSTRGVLLNGPAPPFPPPEGAASPAVCFEFFEIALHMHKVIGKAFRVHSKVFCIAEAGGFPALFRKPSGLFHKKALSFT